MNNRRLGSFSIKRIDIQDNERLVRKIMSECTIIRAEELFFMGHIQYVGYCDQFDEVPEGERCPTYEWQIIAGRIVAKKIED